MPLPFNKNLDLKLLKLVKDNSILYNTKHAKYLDFDAREVVWQKIGDSLSRPAAEFAGIQCQIHFGDYQEKKHKPGFIENLQEYLPVQYSSAWGIEKKIMKAYSQHQGMSPLEAKYLYIKTARALPTYGVTFFLVKEKQKDKKKLVPRLLGINAEAILRLDEVTKEILQQWPLTHVKTYHAGKSQTFTLNFGDYSDKEYSVKTQDCLRIRDILEAYIDIIRRRMLAKPCADTSESMAVCHDNIQIGKSNLIEHVSNNPSKIVTESFVGPTKLMPSDHGSHIHSGATITTVQQIVITDHLQNQQQALKGEVPLRGDMSKDCIQKLNRMNSNSVKIVGLLTEPTQNNLDEVQRIVQAMQDDLPEIEKGIKETADKQAIEDARKMLLDELDDLNNYMNKLAGASKPGHADPETAKDSAECIADLTTQIYFSIDPKTRRRSDLLRRSRKSLRKGEKKEETIRRSSFVAAATTALHAVDTAAHALDEDYTGPKVDDVHERRLEESLEDKLGKLNAAIALYLTAHSDPNNIDYTAAIDSMNTIHELMPELARDAQMLGSTKEPAERKKLLDDMRKLFDDTKNVCAMTGDSDHEKMQEAANKYADTAGKLIFTFARGANADKEREIKELAKDADTKASRLLATAAELACQAPGEAAAAALEAAGGRSARAARDLRACVQLTAPAIHEPHCQSALTAAAEGLAYSVHQMETSWRPLTEHPTRQHMAEPLHTRANDVVKALERLREAYENLGDAADDASLPQREKQRLKFITSMSGAKNKLQGVEDMWNKLATGKPSDEERAQAQRRLEQKMAQLNAAIAALAAATADRENPDYATAELAMATISELMPEIVKDTELVSSDKDEATRAAMLKNIRALCDATRDMCDGAGYQHGQGEAASNFAAASRKLVFLISPGADKGKEKYIQELSSAAHGTACELVSHGQQVKDLLSPEAAAELTSHSQRTEDAAQALLSVAQVTAPSISSPRCQDALNSSVDQLRNTAGDLTASCLEHQTPETKEQCAIMVDAKKQLDECLDLLAGASKLGLNDPRVSVSAAEQEKQRLQFVQSMAGAKRRLDAAQLQLTKPMACHMMQEEAAKEIERKLAERLARLNAAVAALAAAAADRQSPDYAAAENAVTTITELMPGVIQDSRKLCGTKTDPEKVKMLDELKALCEATQELCDCAEQPEGLADAATKYAAASSKLTFLVSPGAEDIEQNTVMGLSTAAVCAASELLSQVQLLSQRAEAAAAGELDAGGARASDAAQALLAVAQITNSSISEPECRKQVVSAAEQLRTSSAQLTSRCPQLAPQRAGELRQICSAQEQLHDCIDKLVQACNTPAYGVTQGDKPSGEDEKRRLKFVNTLSGAKNRLYDAEQQLKQPMLSQPMRPEDVAALEHKLSERLARLNAAIAALAAANADAENPDYAAAERAVKEISELMPQIVQDSRKLGGTKDEAAQAAMLEDLRALCDATRDICENTENGPVVNPAGFHGASKKMMFLFGPGPDKTKEKQVLDLTAAACSTAASHLSLVQRASEELSPAAAAALSPAGKLLHDDTRALHAVAQVTSQTISEPSCSSALISAAERVRDSSSDLTSSCTPHLKSKELQQQVVRSQHQLQDSLDRLVHACQARRGSKLVGIPSSPQDKQRLKFVSSVSGAKERFDASEQQLQEPMICQMMTPEDGAALQSKLADRLARLNAAIAQLTAATADRENPDYAAADQAVKTITELMPQVVQDSRTICGNMTDDEQTAMLQDLKALCEASREICDHAGEPKALSEAASKYSAVTKKLVFLISPNANSTQEKKFIELSADACSKASELVGQAQKLSQEMPHTADAVELEQRAASTADASRALFSVALVTAPTMSSPACSSALMFSAERLRASASALTSSCGPYLENRPEQQYQVFTTQQKLDDSVDSLVHACKVAVQEKENTPEAVQERQRLKFVSGVSGAKNHLVAAQQQLKEPLPMSLVKQEDAVALQHKLADRLAQLNAAIAALAAATADREKPDYNTGHQAIKTILELMPHVIQDSRALSATMDEAGKAALQQDTVALVEATRDLVESVGQPQGLTEAATNYTAAASKLVSTVGPRTQTPQEKQVIALSAASCGKASELLSQVQRLTELVPDAAAAAELDQRGARTADAAEALLTVAQVTGSSTVTAEGVQQVLASGERLRSSARQLTAACAAHAQQRADELQQITATQQQLHDCIDRLVQACKTALQGTDVALSPEQEKQRLKFVTSVSGAKKNVDTAQQQMKEPVICQQMKQADGAKLQDQLSRRLAQLNAAIEALAAATCDGKNPDYPAAERAVITITELVPEVVQDSHTLCGAQDEAGRAATLARLRELCGASRDICNSAGQPKKLHEASAKLANASKKLIFIVSPDHAKLQQSDANAKGGKPAVPVRKPAVPVRSHTVAQAVGGSSLGRDTQAFLDTLRAEESQPSGPQPKIVGSNAKSSQSAKDEQKYYEQFCEIVDNIKKDLHKSEQGLKELSNAKSVSTSLSAEQVVGREQHLEDSLAAAAVQVAALVAANYADKLDYKAATDPIISLTQSAMSAVDDGSIICSSLPEHGRKPFVEDLTGLCQVTASLCDAAKSHKEQLNDAAIIFGDQSVKLLRVVSSDINPALESEVISRAKAIGDTASRIAMKASTVASADSAASALGRDVCGAGARCVDQAGKLVYTAKLIAPTMHHSTCQDTLVSSADNLSSSLMTFSNTWAPLASSKQPNVQELTEEVQHLEELVEKLRKDVRAGKLGRARQWTVNVDLPIRQMTLQVIDTAKKMADHGDLKPDLKKEYISYSKRLEEAVRTLDVATARYQRAPSDKKKRDEMEIATQDLQVALLQTRPSRAGQEQNYIVDFRDFLQDMVREAEELQNTAKTNEGSVGKRTVEDISMMCSKISEDASRLLTPPDNYDAVNVLQSVDDIMDIDMFGQECDAITKEISSLVRGVAEQKARQALAGMALALTEACQLLSFATYSHMLATRSVAYDDTARNLERFQAELRPLVRADTRRNDNKTYAHPLWAEGGARRASSALLAAAARAARGAPEPLCRAVTLYAVAERRQPIQEDRMLENIKSLVHNTNLITMACKGERNVCVVASHIQQPTSLVKEVHDMDYKIYSRNIKTPVLNSEDIDKLLLCERQHVEGTPKQLEEKLQQQAEKLCSSVSTAVQSVHKPESLARGLRAVAAAALQLAGTARALQPDRRPVQSKRIEDAAHEMCLATYSFLKTSELVCQDPDHHDSKRKLMDARRNLNDSINKLVRSVDVGSKVSAECSALQRGLQLQRGEQPGAPQPAAALPYAHCLHALHSHREVLQKLNSEQAMSREEFLKSMHCITSAVSNSAECAAQAVYLLSVSEQDPSVGKAGVADVCRLHRALAAAEDTCVGLIVAHDPEQINEEKANLEVEIKDLVDGLKDAVTKTKDDDLKGMLQDCLNDVTETSDVLLHVADTENKETRISAVMDLLEDVNTAANLVEHPDLVPTAKQVSPDTQKQIDEVVNHSLSLLTNTEELIKQVKSAPEEPETMTWVMFSRRRDVLDAFDALLNSVKTNGQLAKLVECTAEEPEEEEKKSYVQKQFDTASRWLLKPMSKAQVKTNGQQAVRNLIDVATKVTDNLKGTDKEDMRHLVLETEQLLAECSQKYDHEQYSVLMERVRDLKKGIERGVVTRVVEDFMEADTPLEDLDLVADYEKDESKRKFLLEKKIAELLAHLSRVSSTARLIADTDGDARLSSCSEQAELLAPMLVKAAQQRIASPDDEAVIENYKALLARYAESLSKIRDLCDQSVDPMDFVQTACETMERMREESTKHNDPMKCAQTSAAITKLANRVIHVGLTSQSARADPEVQVALAQAQHQLTAATPPPDTRDSKMPDWKDTTAKILQATEEVESLLGGETIFKKQPGPNQPIYNEALNLHEAVRGWSSRDNEIVAVAKRMAVLMAKLSNYMNNDKQREVLATSKSIVAEAHEVARLANKLAHECTDHRIKTNLLQTCERIPTISGQLKMLTTVKGFSLGRHGTQEDKEAMDMLVGNAQSLMSSIQDVVKGAASASVKIMSQRGPRIKWVRKNYY